MPDMAVTIFAREIFKVGQEIVVECQDPQSSYSVVFEDDGSTGYFYALDMDSESNPIQDAVHIYDVRHVADRHLPSNFEIGWSKEGKRAVLIINSVTQAYYDFNAKEGYCRSGFPPPLTRKNESGLEKVWLDVVKTFTNWFV